MDRDKFIGVTIPVWWLLDLQLAPEDLKEKRKALGKCWGWEDDGWFAQPERIGAVFDFLYPRHQILLDELDTQVDDAYVRAKWVDDLIKAKTSVAEEAAAQAATAAQKAAAPPATDKAGVQADDTPAPKKASAFGRLKTAEEKPSEPSAESSVTAASPAGGSPGASGAPATETRKPSPFARKAAANEPVAQNPAAEAEVPAAGAAAPPGGESVEQIKASLSELVADPSVPINQQEADELLRDPEFAKNLAEAESAIEAELEAELAAAESEA